jgi:NAD(P)-dependent dehydrogenase (short-subunit alcohol dehydrogenase family)
VTGTATDSAGAERVADLAQQTGALAGWVNNATVFRDPSLHDTPRRDVLALIAANLDTAASPSRELGDHAPARTP